MYIWILLATIMVALSFFNLSPRADKADAVAEIKATTLLNRFKIEHIAMVKTLECEAALNVDTLKAKDAEEKQGWTVDSENRAVPISAFVSTPEGNDSVLDLGYVKYSDNLPIGYVKASDPKIKHAVLCLNQPIESKNIQVENAEEQVEGEVITYKNCLDTAYRYVLSYAPIPDRWLSKDGNSQPLPVLTNFIADEDYNGVLYGWTECDDQGCVLHGASAARREIERINNQNSTKYSSISKKLSLVWTNGVSAENEEENEEENAEDVVNNQENDNIDYATSFSNTCRTNIPCLFAYTLMKNNDKGSYCKRMYNEWKNKTEE